MTGASCIVDIMLTQDVKRYPVNSELSCFAARKDTPLVLMKFEEGLRFLYVGFLENKYCFQTL